MSTNTTTALTLGYSNVPDPIGMVKSLGTAIARSGAFNVASPEAGEYIAWICVHERKAPHQLAATHDFMQGKLRPKADYVHAEFLAAGGEIEWLDLGEDGQKAKAKMTFGKRGSIPVEYTIEQARKAGLVKPGGNWDKDPATMLRARVITRGIRILHPELFIRIGDPDTTVTVEEKNAGSQLLNVEPAPVSVPKAIEVETVTQPPTVAQNEINEAVRKMEATGFFMSNEQDQKPTVLPKPAPATAPEPSEPPKPKAPLFRIPPATATSETDDPVRLAREVSAIMDAKSLDEAHTLNWFKAMSPEFGKSQRLEDCKVPFLKRIANNPDKWASDVRAWKPKA